MAMALGETMRSWVILLMKVLLGSSRVMETWYSLSTVTSTQFLVVRVRVSSGWARPRS